MVSGVDHDNPSRSSCGNRNPLIMATSAPKPVSGKTRTLHLFLLVVQEFLAMPLYLPIHKTTSQSSLRELKILLHLSESAQPTQ